MNDGGTLKDFLNKNGSNLAATSVEELEKELSQRARNPHRFPLEVFNPRVKPFINMLVEKYQLPTAYVGGAMISCYSAAVGTAYKSSFNDRDYTYLTTWCGLTGISSSGKSTAINNIYAPLRKIQNEFSQEFFDRELEVEKSQEANREIAIKELMFRDTVVATLVRDTLRNNPKGLIKNVDELAEWIKGLNQLSRGEGTDEEFWLSTWSCYPYLKTLSGNKKYYVERPFINIIGGIQWDVLPLLFAKNRGSSGFAFRILFALAEHDDIALMDPFFAMPPEIEQPHTDSITRLYKDLPVYDHFTDAKKCICHRSATELYLKWRNNKSIDIKLKKEREEKQKLAGVFGKINEYILRFAALLKLADRACEDLMPEDEVYRFREHEVIDSETMERALKLADYFYNSALYAFESVDVKNNPNILALQVSAILKAGRPKTDVARFLYPDEMNDPARQEAARKRAARLIKRLSLDFPKYFGGK